MAESDDSLKAPDVRVRWGPFLFFVHSVHGDLYADVFVEGDRSPSICHLRLNRDDAKVLFYTARQFHVRQYEGQGGGEVIWPETFQPVDAPTVCPRCGRDLTAKET